MSLEQQPDLHTELSRRVYEELADQMSIEPIRAWLDKKENRKATRGIDSYDGEGIGPYYCIPLDVFRKCGMDDDEFWYGKSTHHKQTFERRHQCWKCDGIFVKMSGDSLCEPCQEEYDR